MPIKKWIAFFFIIHAFGCMARQPAWVANGNHPGYSPDAYLVGVGLSSRTRDPQADVQKADTHARLEVAKQLKVKIQSNLTSRKEQKNSALLPDTFSSKTSIDVKEEVELLLEGITIVDRYYSEKDHLRYSIAVLDKSETAERLSSEMARHSQHVEAFSRQADMLLENGDVTGALYNRIKALDNYRKYVGKRQMVAVLSPQAADRFGAPPRDPYDGLVELKNSIGLIALDGDMQAGRVGRALDRPLRVKAVYNQKTPIANLPVAAQLRDQAGRAERNLVTGKDGRAEIKVLELHSTGEHLNPVAVGVDWTRLVKEALGETSDPSWAGVLSGPSVNFKYSLRVPGASKVLIEICNRGGDARVDASAVLHPVSVDHLRKKGFLIKQGRRGRTDSTTCSGATGIEAMVRKYKPLTDILIVEKVDVDAAGRRGRGYVFRARMSVTAYDMAHHEIIASLEGEALGGANNSKTAAERAIKDVADELIPLIASRIAEAL